MTFIINKKYSILLNPTISKIKTTNHKKNKKHAYGALDAIQTTKEC